jgi:hypothetical protein
MDQITREEEDLLRKSAGKGRRSGVLASGLIGREQKIGLMRMLF